MVARLGVQIEFVTNVFRKSMPSRARRSMFGVWLTREPYAEMAWAAWSSDMTKITLGAARSVAARRARAKVSSPSSSSFRFSRGLSGNSLRSDWSVARAASFWPLAVWASASRNAWRRRSRGVSAGTLIAPRAAMAAAGSLRSRSCDSAAKSWTSTSPEKRRAARSTRAAAWSEWPSFRSTCVWW